MLFASATGHAACYQQLKATLPESGIIVFGELHGTQEIPQFFLGCIKEFIARKERIDVFLEIDVNENTVLQSYVEGKIEESALLTAPHWQKKDGRASLAMLQLIRSLKQLPSGAVTVHGFDARNFDREQGMMRNLVAQRDKKNYSLVLTGNLHAHLTRGVAWNPDFISFVNYMVQNGEQVLSLNAHYKQGSAWNCAPTCGITQITLPATMHSNIEENIVVLESTDPDYGGYFSVGAITASAPARSR